LIDAFEARESVVVELEIEYAKANITDITTGGLVTIKTDKPVVVRSSWETEELPVEILDVAFFKYALAENELQGFNLTSFTSTEIQIQLNFTQPLYVSSG